MKRNSICLLLLALFLTFCTVCKAEDVSGTNLHFVYIAHETTTPVNVLCDRLRELHDDAEDVDDILIIYLSDGPSSTLSFTGLKDPQDLGRDTYEYFESVIGELQDANSHNVVARVDVDNILQLFATYDFVDNDHRIRYNSVTFDFYAGANFWALNNNENVISHLYTAFDMKSLPRDKFTLNIFTPRGELLGFEDGKPFGDNNVEGINQNVKLFRY